MREEETPQNHFPLSGRGSVPKGCCTPSSGLVPSLRLSDPGWSAFSTLVKARRLPFTEESVLEVTVTNARIRHSHGGGSDEVYLPNLTR